MPSIQASDLEHWIEDYAALTDAQAIRWCDGTDNEWQELRESMLRDGELLPLAPDRPECYLHRSHPDDVARVEHLTFVCTRRRDDAGPNNNWMDPRDAHTKLDGLFRGSMRGRTLYVVPYAMGPLGSPYTRFGVELTDSRYVVANMRLMTRMGRDALAAVRNGAPYVRGEHALGGLDPERRFIMHFPEETRIRSIGSGYGGNALLGKKCHALRIASWQAREEGWMAEHMLLVEIRSPEGRVDYVAAAFPSACGKTNLAMLSPPPGYEGWTIRTIGDDIAWIHPGADGRLWAINPEAGYFGVAPGTSLKTNPNAYRTIESHTIFTNVALTADGHPWWEGLNEGRPAFEARAPLRSEERAGRPSELALHRLRASEPGLVSAQRRPSGCPPDRRPVRRPPCPPRPPCLRGARLDTRSLRRSLTGLRDHGSGHRRRRGRPSRPDGHAAFLWVPLRRLLGALASRRHRRPPSSPDLPRQLVPAGRQEALPLAGLR
jgi:phosphoenolpyruvate carboxykinase (GTP)